MNRTALNVLRIQLNWYKHMRIYVIEHPLETEIFVGITIVSLVFGRLPYLNILFSKFVTFGILVFTGSVAFRLSAKTLLGIIIGIFVITAAAAVGGHTDSAEQLGNILYFLLWYEAWLVGRSLWKDRGH